MTFARGIVQSLRVLRHGPAPTSFDHETDEFRMRVSAHAVTRATERAVAGRSGAVIAMTAEAARAAALDAWDDRSVPGSHPVGQTR